MGKRVFITGGAGYIGSHVVKLLGEKGFDILVYDNLSTGHEWAVLYGTLIKGDICDTDLLRYAIKEFKPDIVIHLAASIDVAESVKSPLKYYQNNVYGTINLLRVMKEEGIGKLIFSSSAAVYGIPSKIPVPEHSEIKPINPYGETKAVIEKLLEYMNNSKNWLKAVSLRYFNVAGADPEGKVGFAYPQATHLIIKTVKAALGKIDKIYIYGTDYPTPDGTAIRDYIHVSDLADIHLQIIKNFDKLHPYEIFNCGYGKGYSVKQIIQTTKKVAKVDFSVEYAPRRKGDAPVLISDVRKLKKKLNWNPKYDDLKFIIKTALEWERNYFENLEPSSIFNK